MPKVIMVNLHIENGKWRFAEKLAVIGEAYRQLQ